MKKKTKKVAVRAPKIDLPFERLEAFVIDANGALRGKWLPRETAGKVFKSGLRLPYSVYAFDIFGQDVLAAGFVNETGDNDGVCRPVLSTLQPVPWEKKPTAQVLMSMEDSKGKPFYGDPRQILMEILALYKKAGLTPVVAAELEFYLLDAKRDENNQPQPCIKARSGKRSRRSQTYGIEEVQAYKPILEDIAHACRVQDIPADTIISESGPGQFEINLNHLPDALAAADCAVLFKHAVRCVARKHGVMGSFMAKPYGDHPGNGMHVHFSVLDKKGNNIFSGKDFKGSATLKHAVAGLLKYMPDCMAVMAPHANSYRRFRAGTHAPTKMAWGYDNRHTAVRIPESDIPATRIEFRVAGADVNPHLVIALLLAAALDGIKAKKNPPPPTVGDRFAKTTKILPTTWAEALDIFAKSKFIDTYMGRAYKKIFLACKYQEKEIIEEQVSSVEHDAYLRDV